MSDFPAGLCCGLSLRWSQEQVFSAVPRLSLSRRGRTETSHRRGHELEPTERVKPPGLQVTLGHTL